MEGGRRDRDKWSFSEFQNNEGNYQHKESNAPLTEVGGPSSHSIPSVSNLAQISGICFKILL